MGIDKAKKINTGVNKTPENPQAKTGQKKDSPVRAVQKGVSDKVHSILYRKK